MTVQDRFLKYISYWTTSEDDKETNPTAEREWELAKALAKELEDMGIETKLSDTCYVYGRIPATKGMEGKTPIGFIAHMDTAPDFSGENVSPCIHANYAGEDVVLSGSGDLLKPTDFPDLRNAIGETLITTDGNTLLGADDKAGVAEIMTLAEELVTGTVPHGEIWIGFTPDEEVGMGADGFDLNCFGAAYAYTVDGGYEGEISYENFNAAAASFAIKGVSVHPGDAKDIMVNAGLLAAELAMELPAEEIPGKTEGREGFFHLTNITGTVSEAKVEYLIRDHGEEKFQQRQQLLQELADRMNQKYGAGTVTLTITQSYQNMASVLQDKMFIVEKAKEAIGKNGLEAQVIPVRGGTDGARLSFMGLPCPNLGTGGHGFHGPFEHITVEAMERVVKVLHKIVESVD